MRGEQVGQAVSPVDSTKTDRRNRRSHLLNSRCHGKYLSQTVGRDGIPRAEWYSAQPAPILAHRYSFSRKNAPRTSGVQTLLLRIRCAAIFRRLSVAKGFYRLSAGSRLSFGDFLLDWLTGVLRTGMGRRKRLPHVGRIPVKCISAIPKLASVIRPGFRLRQPCRGRGPR